MKALNWYINIFTLLFISFGLFIWADDIGSCVSDGNVWDYDEKRCRDDCLLWNKNIGCVRLTSEMQKKLDQCINDTCRDKTIGRFVEEWCQTYQLPYDKERNQCFWDFTPEMCHKLPGNWKYPKVCNN